MVRTRSATWPSWWRWNNETKTHSQKKIVYTKTGPPSCRRKSLTMIHSPRSEHKHFVKLTNFIALAKWSDVVEKINFYDGETSIGSERGRAGCEAKYPGKPFSAIKNFRRRSKAKLETLECGQMFFLSSRAFKLLRYQFLYEFPSTNFYPTTTQITNGW